MTELIRPATWDDVMFIAENMRQADIGECRAGNLSPLDALTHSMDASIIAQTVLAPDTLKPGCIMGVCGSDYGPSWGAIWLLGTDDIARHRVPFLRRSKKVLANLYEDTGREVFYNYTWVNNHVHHTWLRWLGFTFFPATQFQYGRFYPFVKIKG